MFERISQNNRTVTIYIDDKPEQAQVGDSVAAVLLSTKGFVPYRTSQVNGAPSAPYCMIGHCFECLVEIEGQANQLGCQVRVTDGMRIKRQRGRPEVET
jgi:predicted molibdopterin-dependent oxidoreductase YjgC